MNDTFSLAPFSTVDILPSHSTLAILSSIDCAALRLAILRFEKEPEDKPCYILRDIVIDELKSSSVDGSSSFFSTDYSSRSSTSHRKIKPSDFYNCVVSSIEATGNWETTYKKSR